MRRIAITVALAALFVSPQVLAGSHKGAEQKPQVRVAGQTMMEHARSSRSNAEWAKKRPNYAALKPGKRAE
jgi:hypothetical protein